MHIRRPMILAAVTGLAATGLLLPAGPAHAAAPYRLAVTFDGSTSASWLHVEGTGTAPTSSLAISGTGTVTRTTWTTASIPSYVASVPGVVAGDQKVGVFPAYATTGSNFAAVKVTPKAFGLSDVLAPREKNLKFGADIKFNSPLPGRRAGDDGNNVIQRGRASNDQYKIQVDRQSDNVTHKASCVLREEGFPNNFTSVVNDTSLLASSWYRLLCTRTTVGGVDFVTLSVENLTAGTPPNTKSATGTRATFLDYATATTAKPFPIAIGAKVDAAGVIDPNSDQFNGRIDNAYVAIDWP